LVEFDPRVGKRFASQLYTRAYVMLAIAALLGFAAGFILTAPWAWLAGRDPMAMGGLGAVVGIIVGEWRSLMLKVRAQEILCQLKIEKNTRKLLAALEGPRTVRGQ
jgi:hypothetical protein